MAKKTKKAKKTRATSVRALIGNILYCYQIPAAAKRALGVTEGQGIRFIKSKPAPDNE